jgi:hypothetical protein
MRTKWPEREPGHRLDLMPIFRIRGGLHIYTYLHGILPGLRGLIILRFAPQQHVKLYRKANVLFYYYTS